MATPKEILVTTSAVNPAHGNLFGMWTTRECSGVPYVRKDTVELTIEDVERLHTFLYAIKNNKQGVFTFQRLSDEQYQEALRRFNEYRRSSSEKTR